MTSNEPADVISPKALLDAAWVFEERIPFNRVLGLRVENVDASDVVVRFDMRDELVGNFTRVTSWWSHFQRFRCRRRPRGVSGPVEARRGQVPLRMKREIL